MDTYQSQVCHRLCQCITSILKRLRPFDVLFLTSTRNRLDVGLSEALAKPVAHTAYRLEGGSQPRRDDAAKSRAPRAFWAVVRTMREAGEKGELCPESRSNSPCQGRPRAITPTARSVRGCLGKEADNEHSVGIVAWVIVDRHRGDHPHKRHQQERNPSRPAPLSKGYWLGIAQAARAADVAILERTA